MTAKKLVTVPPYRHHKATGQGYVNLNGRRIYLGRFDKTESRQRYHRLVAEWEANGQRLSTKTDITVVELISQFWDYAKQQY